MERHFSEKNEPQEAAPSLERSESTLLEGISPSMRAVEVVIRELAQSEVPVLLLAEAGAGKRTATSMKLLAEADNHSGS